ncbi:23S rRNA (uracil(1939)-C(5))-methyltransferase RlmD [Candidatus Weimeria sp. HCP3S3_B5]|uniref:23S rRNA (uracil(1939)-C(5))-methyltransferase RlmD n=1 Tax=Candidatus Weimeria sp. HCP3S3_B5 TaxID=3438871 RepID=UPI002A99E51D|nr:23S rRNA (uracil(1939)-C(5))-methyltransferase RlmD [Lachnospiraceae bacterium]MDY6351934.1 23S rRNA (uracil(1939)-C(5))-methyltransferase RlmD [Lachnospiraceae bacterium]
MSCIHFGDPDNCGGCRYQDIPYQEELLRKQEKLRELFIEPLPDFDQIFEGITGNEACAYRNKMEFTFGNRCKDGPLELGMHRKGRFYDIVSVPDCQITSADFGRITEAVCGYFREKGTDFYRKRAHTGYLRHLLVRKAHFTGQILVDLVSAGYEGSDEKSLLSGFKDRILSLDLDGEIAGILHTRNNSLADAVTDQGTEVLYGNDFFYEKLCGLTFRISPFSFFQTNSAGAEKLYGKAKEYMLSALSGEKPSEVFDLYSGTGTITQIVSSYATHVTGVEIVPEAVEAARANAGLNGISNCSFICGDVFKVIEGLEERPDMIIVDPPREGLSPKALSKIVSYDVDSIIYIACKPASLARDIPTFTAHGYRTARLSCVDMFPRTDNTECIALFTKS